MGQHGLVPVPVGLRIESSLIGHWCGVAIESLMTKSMNGSRITERTYCWEKEWVECVYLFWDFVGLYIYRLSLTAVALLKGWIKACLGNVSGLYLVFIRAPMVSLLICNCRGIEWWLSWCLVFVQVGSSWMRVIILLINCPPYFEAVLTCNDDLENMRSLFARMRLLVFLLSPNLRWSGGAVLVCSYPFVQTGLGLYGPIIHYWVLRKRARQTLFVSVFPGCFAANLL